MLKSGACRWIAGCFIHVFFYERQDFFSTQREQGYPPGEGTVDPLNGLPGKPMGRSFQRVERKTLHFSTLRM